MSALDLVPKTSDSPAETDLQGAFPAVLARAGKAACFAADEFFRARLSNPHTRTAYAHQVSRFLTWCEDEVLELHQVTPGLAGRFLDDLPYKAPTKNQALAALATSSTSWWRATPSCSIRFIRSGGCAIRSGRAGRPR